VNYNPFAWFGFYATAMSSINLEGEMVLKGFNPDEHHHDRLFSEELSDGTKVGGLLFEYDEEQDSPKPLLMASFGFLQDRWGTEACKFYELYLEDVKHRIPAHVLILDHPTSGPFLANNGHLSMGSYDDARMWIEIARSLKDKMKLTGIHLFGVSMSGQTVVHALIEDTRLGLNLFDSGIAVSIAPDFNQVPGKQLAQFDTPKGVENPWQQGLRTPPDKTLAGFVENYAIWMLIEKQFIPNYRWVHPTDKQFTIRCPDVACFFRKAYEDRISFLREQRRVPDTWNYKDFSLENLESFMATTRIADVIDRVQTPLVLVSSRDDPAVAHRMFEEVVVAAGGNPWIASYETDNGGHFGFDIVYGKDYIGRIIRLMLDPQVLRVWEGSPEIE
jgi:fermentation-respiration switch protein FrsA (DUF1100 family)